MIDDVDRKTKAAIDMIPRSHQDYESQVNLIVALNSAHDERTTDDAAVHLSDQARDRLLFYGRQDVGHGVLNTISILRAQRMTNRLLGALILLTVILIIVTLRR